MSALSLPWAFHSFICASFTGNTPASLTFFLSSEPWKGKMGSYKKRDLTVTHTFLPLPSSPRLDQEFPCEFQENLQSKLKVGLFSRPLTLEQKNKWSGIF